MNCPYCDKKIIAFTGLQEVQKFQKHLKTCKKNPQRKIIVDDDGKLVNATTTSLLGALDIRAESGQ